MIPWDLATPAVLSCKVLSATGGLLTLNLGAYIAGIGDLVLPGGRVDDVIGTMYLLTLSFTFR